MSFVSEIVLPDSWVYACLAEVSEFSPKPSIQNLDSDDLVHFVPMAAVAENFCFVDVSQCRSLKEVRSGYTSFIAGDVLLAKITPCMENGKGGLVPDLSHGLGFGSTEFHVLRANSVVRNTWLAYYLSQPAFRNFARANMTGTAGQMRVPAKWLRDVKIPIPPVADQIRIVNKLEQLLSDLDAGVAELKAAQKKLTQYRQSLLKAAVEGALTAQWRDEQQAKGQPTETGAQLLERILVGRRARWEAKQLAKFKEQGRTPPEGWKKKYPEPGKPDTTGLPELPEGWVWASVDQLGNVQLGRQRSPNKVGKLNPTPYIRAANITESGINLTDVFEMEFSDSEKTTFALKAGDVLLTEASGSPEHVGRPAIWNQKKGLFCFQNTVLRFTPDVIRTEFAFFSFLAMQKLGVFRKLSGGVGINHLSAGKFSKLSMPLPPLIEQDVLITSIQESFDQISEQVEFQKKTLTLSTAQRQNILRAAFSGHLVPQDPNDEPASILLERIRAERAKRDTEKRPKTRSTKKSA